MKIDLHANATTTPKSRAYIQASTASVAELARELGVTETTIRRWKGRTSQQDGSHVRHNLGQSTSVAEEELIVALRQDVRLSLDDIVEVMNRCVNPKLSRSAIHRCLKRRGAAERPKEANDAAPRRAFDKDIPCGFIHIDLKHLTRLEKCRAYVFVAIDRATRFVHIEIIQRRDANTVAQCLKRFLKAFPHKVHAILTDNGAEFTDRFGGARWKTVRKPSGRHPFDKVCARNRIEHRLTKPFHPQTNGMAERFNRRLAEAIRARPDTLKNEGKNKFLSHAERNAFLHAFVHDYNRTRLRCLNYQAPILLLHNLTGDNTKAGT